MNVRALVMLAAALALATASTFMARSWIVQQATTPPPTPPPTQPAPATTHVVVAAGALSYGSPLQRQNVRLANWPLDSVPEGAFASIEEVFGESQSGTEPRIALRAFVRGEPILKSKLSGFGARPSLSTLIAPGWRAATIRVNDVNGVAGFVLPGDRVDVLLTHSSGTRSGYSGPATDVLLQNMKVLGIDQDANEERAKPAVVRTVTLEVTQEQAQKLTLAQKLGTLSLALRHIGAVNASNPNSVTALDLPHAAAPVTVAAPKDKRQPAAAAGPIAANPAVSSVRIVRGMDMSLYEVAVERPTTPPEARNAELEPPSGATVAPSAADTWRGVPPPVFGAPDPTRPPVVIDEIPAHSTTADRQADHWLNMPGNDG